VCGDVAWRWPVLAGWLLVLQCFPVAPAICVLASILCLVASRCNTKFMQVLGQLPAHLAVTVVQAADATLDQCLTVLPERFHPLVLSAQFPAITRSNACHIHPIAPHKPPPSREALAALFSAVATFTSLQELHMGIVGPLPDAYGIVAQSFERALTECSQLQSLAINADHRSQGFLTAQVAPTLARCLPRLANLRRLNLHACSELMAQLTDDRVTPGSVRSASFRDLFAAICRCSALEELSLTMMLTHEGIASDRDHFLASHLAGLPATLRVLKLRSSVTGGCLRALDSRLTDDADGVNTWLPELQELDVGMSALIMKFAYIDDINKERKASKRRRRLSS
jgi:hypothetical protein